MIIEIKVWTLWENRWGRKRMLQTVKICVWGWGQEFARPVRAGQEDGVEKREQEQDRKSVSRATLSMSPPQGLCTCCPLLLGPSSFRWVPSWLNRFLFRSLLQSHLLREDLLGLSIKIESSISLYPLTLVVFLYSIFCLPHLKVSFPKAEPFAFFITVPSVPTQPYLPHSMQPVNMSWVNEQTLWQYGSWESLSALYWLLVKTKWHWTDK